MLATTEPATTITTNGNVIGTNIFGIYAANSITATGNITVTTSEYYGHWRHFRH